MAHGGYSLFVIIPLFFRVPDCEVAQTYSLWDLFLMTLFVMIKLSVYMTCNVVVKEPGYLSFLTYKRDFH